MKSERRERDVAVQCEGRGRDVNGIVVVLRCLNYDL